MFIFTGCDVEYNLVIDNHKRVTEEIIVLEDNSYILKNADNIDHFLYQRENEYFNETDYSYERLYLDEKSGLNVTNSYKSIDDYVAGKTYTRLFEKAYIESDDKFYSFKTFGEYYRNSVFSTPLEAVYRYNIDKIKVNIQFYNVVDGHNADKVDEEKNIYTWYLESDNLNEQIEFTLSDDVRYDIMLKAEFSENKILIISVVLIIAILTFVLIKLKEIRKQNNRI